MARLRTKSLSLDEADYLCCLANIGSCTRTSTRGDECGYFTSDRKERKLLDRLARRGLVDYGTTQLASGDIWDEACLTKKGRKLARKVCELSGSHRGGFKIKIRGRG